MSENKQAYMELVKHYEACFLEHGAIPKGVDWPNELDLQTRFKVMLDGFKSFLSPIQPLQLLDVGCGYGALVSYLELHQLQHQFAYHGIDLSLAMIAHAKAHFSQYTFEVRDLLLQPLPLESVDFAVMNGVFTERRSLTVAQMENFLVNLLQTVFATVRLGVAFNVMNYHADWHREDLFYLSFDRAAELIRKTCGRHFTFQVNYGLYEYTIYVYKHPLI